MGNYLRTFQTLEDAYRFLQEIGASSKLILHVMLVGEASELLISKLHQLQVEFDENFVRLGVALHDSGKILHPIELIAKGKNHETDGEKLLLANGVDPKLARCCRSHGQWQVMECSFEELLIALADRLWKGKRDRSLETMVITRLTEKCHKDYWDLFLEMDSCFEIIDISTNLQHSYSKKLNHFLLLVKNQTLKRVNQGLKRQNPFSGKNYGSLQSRLLAEIEEFLLILKLTN